MSNSPFIINSYLLPRVPEGCEIDEHVTDPGYLRLGDDDLTLLEPTEDELRGDKPLLDAIRRIPRNETLNATDAGMLVLNHRFIPEEWKPITYVIFPGTRFKDARGRTMMTCLHWCVPIDAMDGFPTGFDGWDLSHFPVDGEWIAPMRYLAIAKRVPR